MRYEIFGLLQIFCKPVGDVIEPVFVVTEEPDIGQTGGLNGFFRADYGYAAVVGGTDNGDGRHRGSEGLILRFCVKRLEKSAEKPIITPICTISLVSL